MRRKGFTLIELLITIAFLVILVTGTYLYLFTKGRGQRDLENTTTKIVALLREANSRAVSQSEDADWGIRFEMGDDDRGRYILFFDTPTTENYREFVVMPPTLHFDTSTFSSGIKDVVFEKVTGEAAESALIRVMLAGSFTESTMIRIYQSGLIGVYDGAQQNVALGKDTEQSTTYSDATADGYSEHGVDGNTDGTWPGNSLTHTRNTAPLPSWWEVDLAETYPISHINIWNRTDCCVNRIEDYYVIVSDTPNPTISTPGVWINHQDDDAGTPTTIPVTRTGRYVRVIFDAEHTPQYLHLAEVEVFSPEGQ